MPRKFFIETQKLRRFFLHRLDVPLDRLNIPAGNGSGQCIRGPEGLYIMKRPPDEREQGLKRFLSFRTQRLIEFQSIIDERYKIV